MTKFEPEIAYRILADKQRRLYENSESLLWEMSKLDIRGELNYYGELWRGQEITALEDQADSMWDVLNYLRTRIEEEQHGAI